MTAVPAHGTTHIAPSLCRVVALLSAVCWCWVLRMASEMPDLSHLTPEEREIIESVVHRQKQEEQKEQEIMRLVYDWIMYDNVVYSHLIHNNNN